MRASLGPCGEGFCGLATGCLAEKHRKAKVWVGPAHQITEPGIVWASWIEIPSSVHVTFQPGRTWICIRSVYIYILLFLSVTPFLYRAYHPFRPFLLLPIISKAHPMISDMGGLPGLVFPCQRPCHIVQWFVFGGRERPSSRNPCENGKKFQGAINAPNHLSNGPSIETPVPSPPG